MENKVKMWECEDGYKMEMNRDKCFCPICGSKMKEISE